MASTASTPGSRTPLVGSPEALAPSRSSYGTVQPAYSSAQSMSANGNQHSVDAAPTTRRRAPPTEAHNIESQPPVKSGKHEWNHWLTSLGVFVLDNKGSVARDHLASERTYLAWLRTSLAMASIGIAITQLFRLPSSTSTAPSTAAASGLSSRTLSASQQMQLLDQLASGSTEPSAEAMNALVELLRDQAQRLDMLQQQVNDPLKYRHLGKPIGGTFIALALVFLFLGSARYFRCQTALMVEPQSQFPPSRRSVMFATSTTTIIIVSTFAAILATR